MSVCRLCSRFLQSFENEFCTWCLIQAGEKLALPKIRRLLALCVPPSKEIVHRFNLAWDTLWNPLSFEVLATLNSRVHAEKKTWQIWKRCWQQYEKAMRNIPAEAEFICLLHELTRLRSETRAFFRENAGRDVDVQNFTAHVQADAALTSVIHAANLAVIDTESENPKDVFKAAVSSMRRALPQALPLALATGMDSPSKTEQEAAMITLTGWVSTQVHSYKEHRIAMERNGDTFLERLAEDVWEAWRNLPQKRLDTFLTESKRLFDAIRRNRYKLQKPKRDIDDPLRNPANQIEVEDLITNESDYLAETFQRAGLSHDEEASFRLRLDGHADEQIAKSRNKSLSAVKQDLLRARKKLKRVFPM